MAARVNNYAIEPLLYLCKAAHFLGKRNKKTSVLYKNSQGFFENSIRPFWQKTADFCQEQNRKKIIFSTAFFLKSLTLRGSGEFSTTLSVENVDKNPCNYEFSSVSTRFSTDKNGNFPRNFSQTDFRRKRFRICRICTKTGFSGKILHSFAGARRPPFSSFLTA